jgi:predicted RNase H-like HicB family nuclease
MPEDATLDVRAAVAAKRYARCARIARHAAGSRAQALLADGGAVSADAGSGRRIQIVEEDGFWVARDDETGVASQGGTPMEALANLQEAVGLHEEALAADTPAPEPDAPWFDEE